MRSRAPHGLVSLVALLIPLGLVGCGSAASAPPPATAHTAASAPAPAPSHPSSPPAAGSASTPSEPVLNVAYVAPIAAMAPLWIAHAIHAYSRHHVRVHISLIHGSAAVAALVAHNVDVLEVSAPSIIQADLRTGSAAHMVLIASALNYAIASLDAAASIHSAAQLKGAVVASDRPGTPTDYNTRVMLSRLGLKPSEVKLLPIGGSAPDLAALESGQAKAANLSPPYNFVALSRGFHELVNLYNLPYQNVGLAVVRSRIPELRPALVPFLAAYRDGIAAYYSQPALARQVLTQYTKEKNATLLAKTYDFFDHTLHFNTSLQPTVQGTRNILDYLAQTIPAAKGATPAEFLDSSLLGALPTAS